MFFYPKTCALDFRIFHKSPCQPLVDFHSIYRWLLEELEFDQVKKK